MKYFCVLKPYRMAHYLSAMHLVSMTSHPSNTFPCFVLFFSACLLLQKIEKAMCQLRSLGDTIVGGLDNFNNKMCS